MNAPADSITTQPQTQSEGHPPAPHDVVPAYYRNMIEQAGDAMIFIDRAGAIQVWNRGAEKILGYTTSEARHMSLDRIIPENLRQPHWDGFNRAVANGHTKHGDRVLTTKAIHKDGHKIYMDLHFCIIKDDAGIVVGALSIGRDCTERYLAEKAARKAAQQQQG